MPSSDIMEMVNIVAKTVVYQGNLKIYKVTFSNNEKRYFTASYFDIIDNHLSKYNVEYYISDKEFAPIIFETTQHKALLMPIRYTGN